MATAKQMIDVLIPELDYTEKNDETDLDSKVGPTAGDGNYTKFARDLARHKFFNGDKNGYDWCTMIPNWGGLQITGTKAKTMKLLCQDGDLGAGCVYARQYYKNHNRLYAAPKVGDQAFFGNDPEDPDHTGIVESVGSNGDFVTIEGNWGNKVCRVEHNYKHDPYWKVCEFGRPMYDDAVVDSPIEEPEPVVEPSKGLTEYIVKEGDTLSEIAEDLGVDYMALVINNGIANPDVIYVGQRLVIGGNKATAPTVSDINVGDRVKIEQNALVYGKPYMFSSWVYNIEVYICQIDDNSVLVATTPRPSAYIGWVEKNKVRKV